MAYHLAEGHFLISAFIAQSVSILSQTGMAQHDREEAIVSRHRLRSDGTFDGFTVAVRTRFQSIPSTRPSTAQIQLHPMMPDRQPAEPRLLKPF